MPTWGKSGAGRGGPEGVPRGSPGAPHAPQSRPSPSGGPGPARAHRPRPRHVTEGRARCAGPPPPVAAHWLELTRPFSYWAAALCVPAPLGGHAGSCSPEAAARARLWVSAPEHRCVQGGVCAPVRGTRVCPGVFTRAQRRQVRVVQVGRCVCAGTGVQQVLVPHTQVSHTPVCAGTSVTHTEV